MNKPHTAPKEPLPEIIDEKCKRKLKARQEKERPIFFGFGMFGMVGWSIAVPTVIGTLLGRWLDARQVAGGRISWTLTCLIGGLLIGGAIAWRWMNREGQPR